MGGLLEDRNQMKRRIRHIARFGSTHPWTALALLLFLVLALIGLTDGMRRPDVPDRTGGVLQPLR